MAQILVVEDEVDICNLIRSHLESAGHTVHQAFDGPAALTLVERHSPQLVILDWMLPGLDGLEVCRQIRKSHLMPIIMLTARAEEVDRVLGLEVGADDYVTKPFGMRELMARVRAVLRRVELDSQATPVAASASDAPGGESAVIERGPLCIDSLTHTVVLEGIEVDLTPKEFELLWLFAAHPGRAYSREYLVEHVWGYDFDGMDRTVDSHIMRLRKKLGSLGDKIVTVWGVGYRFVI
ncbi:MAG TPA: response regulator transcription factor [Ktedonobacterales bacterium]